MNRDETLENLEFLLEKRERGIEPGATDREIYKVWCDFLSNFPKIKDMGALRNQIDYIDNYVERRKPGLLTKLKKNVINNKYFISQLDKFRELT